MQVAQYAKKNADASCEESQSLLPGRSPVQVVNPLRSGRTGSISVILLGAFIAAFLFTTSKHAENNGSLIHGDGEFTSSSESQILAELKEIGNPGVESLHPNDNSLVQLPHIMLVLTDDQGYNDIGYSSNDLYDFTPHIDELMRSGLKLETYYAQHLCTPARGALLTGKYPVNIGLQHDVIHVDAPWGLPLDHKLLPEYLQENGYATHMIGKWHLGHFNEQFLPQHRGFDSFFGYLADTQDPFSHVYPSMLDGEWMSDLMIGEKFGNYSLESREGEYDAIMFTDRASDILQHHDPDMPLFLYIAHQNTHSPFVDMPDDWFTTAQRTKLDRVSDSTRHGFGESLMMLDAAVKNLTTALKDVGFWDNTLLIYSSDNGGCHGAGAYNYPLRGQKYYYFEGGMRVHAFIAGGMLPPSMVNVSYAGMMHITDWLPTILGMIGEDRPEELDGYNQWSSLVGDQQSSPRSELLYNLDPYQEVFVTDGGSRLVKDDENVRGALRMGDWKLILNEFCLSWFTPIPTDEIKTPQEGSCNITECADPSGYTETSSYLFNLKNDPYEKENLIQDYPEVAQVLELRMRDYLSSMKPAAWHSTDVRAYGQWSKAGNFISPWVSNAEIEGLSFKSDGK